MYWSYNLQYNTLIRIKITKSGCIGVIIICSFFAIAGIFIGLNNSKNLISIKENAYQKALASVVLVGKASTKNDMGNRTIYFEYIIDGIHYKQQVFLMMKYPLENSRVTIKYNIDNPNIAFMIDFAKYQILASIFCVILSTFFTFGISISINNMKKLKLQDNGR
jgi:hypothetical protein